MILVGSSDAIAAGSTNATTVNCTICGAQTDASSPPVAQKFDVLYQGQLASSVTALITNSGSQEILVKSIHLFNTGGSIQTVTFALNGTASSNYICTIAIPANGWATYVDGKGWEVRTSTGVIVTSSIFLGNGLGTPASATTALTASTQVVQGGTLFQLPTGSLAVGQRFRWHLNLVRTAAGTATWTAKVCYGTAGTNADAAIATWTSGTNTAAIDQAMLIIECRITALGSGTSATAACTAFYVNRLTEVTGFGKIDPVPGSTAGFDSTAATPFFHVDITSGASAVVTGVGMAEQIT
jgi:hypothetical protein